MARLCTLLILFLTIAANSQTIDCYSRFMAAGDEALQRGLYTEATQYYESARQCVDINAQQDSLAASAYAGAYEIWTSSLGNAFRKADIAAQRAILAEDSMRVALEQSIRDRTAAQKAKEEAEQAARESEAKRLALVSKELLDQGRELQALEASLEALESDGNDPDVYRAFGNAAFVNFKTSLREMPGGIMQLHFKNSELAAARGANAVYEKVNDAEFFSSQGIIAYDAVMTDVGMLFATNRGIIKNDHSTGEHSVVWPSSDPISTLINGNEDDLLAINRNNNFYRWVKVTEDMSSPIIFKGHEAPVLSIELSSDKLHLISRSLDKTVSMWTLEGDRVWTYEHDNYVNSAQFSVDGAFMISTTTEGTMHFVDTKTGEAIKIISAHDAPISACHVLSSGNVLTSSLNGSAVIWSLDGNKFHQVTLDGGGIDGVSISADNSVIVLKLRNNKLVICNAELEIVRTLNPPDGSIVLGVTASADGKYILTAHDDHSVHLWDTAGKEVMAPDRFEAATWSYGFTEDSSKLWACSKDGSGWICTVPDVLLDQLINKN